LSAFGARLHLIVQQTFHRSRLKVKKKSTGIRS
jgi:hypothetical protein